MRIIPCLVMLAAALPAGAEQVHTLDFRGKKFDTKLLDYTLANPERYLTPEKEGLRLRFTGKDVPPARQTAGIFWRFDARGDFVVRAKYEILRIDRPKTGQGVGAGIYVHLKNPEQEGIAIARRSQPAGEPFLVLNYMATDEKGATRSKIFKKHPTGDRSLRGAFRLSREGKVLIASFAEADGDFAELYRTDVSPADLDLIRFAGFAGGDTNAVLDMRILEFHFQGKDLVYYDRNVMVPGPGLPNPVDRPDTPRGQVVAPVEAPLPEPELPNPVDRPDTPRGQVVAPVEAQFPEPGKTATDFLLLSGSLCLLFILFTAIGGTVLLLRLRKSQVSDTARRKATNAAKTVENQSTSKKAVKRKP